MGNLGSVLYPNGTVAIYAYDELNRLTSLENSDGAGGVISSYTYTLAPTGHRTRVVENNGRAVDYVYDDLYRLVEENIVDAAVGNSTIAYTYDAVGNRLAKTDSDGTTTYTYDDNDRLLTEQSAGGSVTYSYDENGNMVVRTEGGDGATYTYDYENRLIAVDTDGDGTNDIQYEYDADGNRTAAIRDGERTEYVVDTNRAFAQVLGEVIGNMVIEYVYGHDLISMTRAETGKSFYHYDGQMSARQLTDANGDVTDSYTYDAFGRMLSRVGDTLNDYLYGGEQLDGSLDAYYLRARFYSSDLGRFISTDPLLGKIITPNTLHRYLYAGADPVNHNDPSGEQTNLIGVMVAVSISGILAGIQYHVSRGAGNSRGRAFVEAALTFVVVFAALYVFAPSLFVTAPAVGSGAAPLTAFEQALANIPAPAVEVVKKEGFQVFQKFFGFIIGAMGLDTEEERAQAVEVEKAKFAQAVPGGEGFFVAFAEVIKDRKGGGDPGTERLFDELVGHLA